MQKIKYPAFDGKFYPKETIELEKKIRQMFDQCPHFYDYRSRALIVPHAGYFYSGHVAANTYQYLDSELENIFLIAPAHYVDFKGIALSGTDFFSTPLGMVEVNQEINKELLTFSEIEINDAAFEKEHAIEVQLPFLQTLLPKAKIVPIICNTKCVESLKNIFDKYFKYETNGFVVSSDLSHFYPNHEAQKIDEYTANMIESNETKNFHPAQACGAQGIISLCEFSKQNNFSLIRVQLTNSSEKTKDDAGVVGYGGWFLAEQSKNTFLKDNFFELLIDIAKESIKYGLETGKAKQFAFAQYPPVLKELGACFVTLEMYGQLRGCVGSVIAQNSLLENLSANAFNAAFKDDRFNPLAEEELDEIKVSVSLLSNPYEIKFTTEEDLYEKIVPFKDGIIIKDNNHSAVYLPEVWEQLPDKFLFMESLKLKAGLDKNYFSKSLKVFVFHTEYIKEM